MGYNRRNKRQFGVQIQPTVGVQKYDESLFKNLSHNSEREAEIKSAQDDYLQYKKQQQPQKENKPKEHSGYRTESPEEYEAKMLDPMMFQDQIIPSILDPNYDEWASRQIERSKKLNDSERYGTKAISNTGLKAAQAYYSLGQSFDPFWNDTPKESNIDRLNRRLFENKTFGELSDNKKLTQKEIQEIHDYQMITNPIYARDFLEETMPEIFSDDYEKIVAEREREELKKLLSTPKPANYSSEYKDPSPYVIADINGAAIASLFTNRGARSAAADFLIKSNESQMEVSAGKIARSDELLAMVDNTRTYAQTIRELSNNLFELQRLQSLIKGGNASKEVNERIYQLLDQNKQLRERLNDGSLYRTANNLASWSPGTVGGYVAQTVDDFTDRLIGDDLGGIRKYLTGLGGYLDNLNKLTNRGRNYDEQWIREVNNTANNVDKLLNNFTIKTGEKQNGWRKDMEVDMKDINRLIDKGYDIDDYYRARQKILEHQNYDWRNPVDMMLYGWSGIAGGSNSSWWKSIISMSSKGIGATAPLWTGGSSLVFTQLAAIATSFEADKTAGSDENNIESSNKIAERIRTSLEREGKYNDFLIEGAAQAGYNDENKKLLQNTKDAEKIKQYIMDSYIAGMWQSTDPDITRMHADAVIGTNNQFYNNQPVNTADAMIGSVVDILSLEPIRYLNKATRIGGRFLRRKINKYGAEHGLSFAGLKGITEAPSMIAQGADAVLKTPAKGLADLTNKVIFNPVGKVVHAAATKIKDIPGFVGMEHVASRAILNTKAYLTAAPDVYMKSSRAVKGVGNVATRIALDTASEMTQEGVQGIQSYNGDIISKKVGSIAPDYDIAHNRPMLERVVDDLGLAAKAWQTWFFQGNPEWQSDADIVASMNATPMLTLFGPNTFQVAVQAHNTLRDMSIIDMLWNQIYTEKTAANAQIRQGAEYAKYITPQDRERMLERFARFKKIAGTHRSAVSRLDALNRLQNGKQEVTLLEEDENAIPDELIDAQQEEYERIYKLANSNQARLLGIQAGLFKVGEDSNGDLVLKRGGRLLFNNTRSKYAKLVSMLNYRDYQLKETRDALSETDSNIQSIFGTDIKESDEWHVQRKEEIDTQVDENEPATINPEAVNTSYSGEDLDTARALSRLYALMQLVEDYEKIETVTGVQNLYLERARNAIVELKKQLARRKISVETYEDILSALSDSNLEENLRLLNPQATEELSTRELVEGMAQWHREREIREYDVLTQQALKANFLIDPIEQIRKWEDVYLSDKKLEKMLEEDYINQVRRYEKAARREVKDKQTYIGNDGRGYITKIKKDKDGNDIVVKHRINFRNGQVDKEELEFDRVEYDEYFTEREKHIQKRIEEKRKKNNAIADSSGTKESPVVQPVVASVEEGGVYKSGANVLIKDPITGEYESGFSVLEYDGNRGVYLLHDDESGIDVEVEKDNVFKPVAGVNDNKYEKGTVVLLDNSIEAVVEDVLPYYIDEDEYTVSYQYRIRTGDSVQYVDEERLSVKEMQEGAETKKFKPNSAQQAIIDALDEYKQKTDKILKREGESTYTTPFNYFIKIKGRFMQYMRVHGFLDLHFGKQFESDAVEKRKKEIYEEVIQFFKDGDHEAFSRYIDDKIKEAVSDVKRAYGLSDDFNLEDDENLAQIVKTQISVSEEYKKKQHFSSAEIHNTAMAIASIFTDRVDNVAVKAGYLFDKIARLFFKNDDNVENEPEYKMSDKTFSNVKNQLKELKRHFEEDLHWYVDTTPYVWFTTLPDNTRIAGETDAIAIDQEGGIHILDFKTTRSERRFGKYYDIVSETDKWYFVEEEAKLNGKVGNRNYAQQYALQLGCYAQMVQITLQQFIPNAKVKSVELIPAVLQYTDENENTLVSMENVKVLMPINLTEIEELSTYFNKINSYFAEPQPDNTYISEEEVEDAKEALTDIDKEITSALNIENAKGVSLNTLDKLQEIRVKTHEILDRLTSLDRKDSNMVDAVKTEYNVIIKEASDLLNQAKDEHLKFINDQLPQKPDTHNDDWINDPEESVSEQDRSSWYKFNNLHSVAENIMKMEGWLPSIIKSDFLKNSTFEIVRTDMPPASVNISEEDRKKLQEDYYNSTYGVRVTYKPFGQNIITFKHIVFIRLGNDPTEGDIRALRNSMNAGKDNLSTMGRNFIRQYKSLFQSLQPGEIIVAGRVERTNGVIQIDTKEHNLLETIFGQDPDVLYKLIDGENSLIGVADKTNRVFEVSTGERTTTFAPKVIYDPDTEKEIINSEIAAGSVVFLHKFRYDEDPEGSERKVPIVLKGRKLSNEDCIFIYNTLANKKNQNKNAIFTAKLKDGSTKTVSVAGLTNRKLLQMIARFGGQALEAGHEFVFNYGVKKDESGRERPDYNTVIITDMTSDELTRDSQYRPNEKIVVENEKGEEEIVELQELHRKIVSIDLRNEDDVKKLVSILKATDMHINQIGVMKSRLNSDSEQSWFGTLGTFFVENDDVESITLEQNAEIQFTAEDVLPDATNINRSITGIAWAIKHNHATTNAIGIENPLISIHSLKKIKVGQIESEKDRQNRIAEEKTVNPMAQPDPITVPDEEIAVVDETTEEKKMIDDALNSWDDPDIDGMNVEFGFGSGFTQFRKDGEKMSDEEVKKELKEIHRLIGKLYGVEVSDDIIKITHLSGVPLAGLFNGSIIKLSKLAQEGVGYHETFHAIFEVLTPNIIRKKLYDWYRKEYGEKFKKVNGRELIDRDISENFAEMFRYFMLERDTRIQLKTPKDLLRIFKNINDYRKALMRLPSWKVAAYFALVNSGAFRFKKPSKESLEHFMNVLGGYAPMIISGKNKEGKTITVDLKEFEEIGGNSRIDDIVESIIFYLCRGYSLDAIASNASRLSTKRTDISKLFKQKGETTEESSWFRVLTGAYIKQGEEMNINDVKAYIKIFRNSLQMRKAAKYVKDTTKPKTIEELNTNLVQYIWERERNKSYDDLTTLQKQFSELFSDEAWPIIQQRINQKLRKKGLDSQYEREQEDKDKKDNPNLRDEEGEFDHNGISTDVGDHDDDASYSYDRTESAGAAIKFLLGTIPDERFATQEDVDAGLCSSTTRERTDKNGKKIIEPVLISNRRSGSLQTPRFLPMKLVSNKLLLLLHTVKTAKQLYDELENLKYTDPVFWRINNIYHAYYDRQILRHEDDTIRIQVNGKELPKNAYRQVDGGGITVFMDAESGEIIKNAEVMINNSVESFVTQFLDYLSVRRLEFFQLNMMEKEDEEGEDIDGAYTYNIADLGSAYGEKIYPSLWFARLLFGDTGIFNFTENTEGKVKLQFTENGETRFRNAIDNLQNIYNHVAKHYFLVIDGQRVDLNIQNPDHLRPIIKEFVRSLNVLGIDISEDALIYRLEEEVRQSGTRNQDLSDRFKSLITAAKTDVSFQKFISLFNDKSTGVLVRMYKRSEGGARTEFSGNVFVNANPREGKLAASGTYIYSENAFVKYLAAANSQYKKAQEELMVVLPGNKRGYTMSEGNTASDITDDINDSEANVKEGTIIKGRILQDMEKYIYNFSTQTIKTARGLMNKEIGSLIIKELKKRGKLNLVLHTHAGGKVQGDKTGGTKYTKMAIRENLISRLAILQKNGLLFPTLADKSNFFYISGLSVPGINYDNIKELSISNLGKIEIDPNNPAEANFQFDFGLANAQLDQLIEYAFCERNSIEKELNRREKFPIIEFFSDNRTKFCGLTELVLFDKNGKRKILSLTDTNKSDRKNLELADKYFFGEGISQKARREMMALTLQEGFMRLLETVESYGLIVASGNVRRNKLDENGVPIRNVSNEIETVKANRMFQYRNVGLDYDIIKELKEKYKTKLSNETDGKVQNGMSEANAICAYLWDMYMRGIIGVEETERIYTGAPLFFKWKYGKVFNKTLGKFQDVLTDRHSDESKRLGGFASTGERNRLDLENFRRTYTCAEVEDWKVKSKLHEHVEKAMIDSEIRQAYFDLLSDEIYFNDKLSEEERNTKLEELNDDIYKKYKDIEEIKKDLDERGQKDLYETAKLVGIQKASSIGEDDRGGKINVADGAAYITAKTAKNLLRIRGKYVDEVRDAFEYLESTTNKPVNPLRDAEAYRIIMNALGMGAEKYSAYGYRMTGESDEQVPVHYYNKFALFPLFKRMTSGFTAAILSKMEEDGVDMLMMHSAVKNGSEEPAKCDPDTFTTKEQFEKFHFHTYSQDYSFIRRQLNTDVHETDDSAVGTQMTKVVLSTLDPNRPYKLRNGEYIRGKELLQNIMDAINSLSDIGKEEIKKEFFIEGTEKLDVEKFSAFLRNELLGRDADENMLDAVRVVEEDGEKRLNLPIEAVSSANWIQSIIVSKINKEVIDINVTGNAFYQRSVWGMEGSRTILTEDDISKVSRVYNGGKDLLVVNEEGSMDAMISIDFFYNVIPEAIRYDFEKSRQWLIDHDFISGIKTGESVWHNAEATTIASRIPTQAKSSIHALRFVDVLPAVRGTIVLPREFTAITGSDFDIDKLYLVSKSVSIKTSSVEIDGKKRKQDTVIRDFDKSINPKKYYRNLLLDSYLTLLKSHGRYSEKDGMIYDSGDINVALRSIDQDTSLPHDVLDIILASRPKKRYLPYQFGNIAHQIETAAAFLTGKTGIGPFALNNNNQILTQLYGVKFKKLDGGILDLLGCTDLSKSKDKNNKSILSWISGFINAHVDVAKDPWIFDLNVNPFTYNMINLLIRTGMGERTLFFVAQPIMFELAKLYDAASGAYMSDQDLSKTRRQDKAILDYIIQQYGKGVAGSNKNNKITINTLRKYMLASNMTVEERDAVELEIAKYAKAIFGINNDGSYSNTFYIRNSESGEVVEKEGSLLQDILTNPNARKFSEQEPSMDNMNTLDVYAISIDGNQIPISPYMIQLYVAYIYKNLDKYGQALSDLVNATKIDTKKQGKSYIEQQAYLEKYNNVFDPDKSAFEAVGLRRLQGVEGESYIHKKTTNAIDLYETIIKQISLQATDNFKNLHDSMMETLNSSSENVRLSAKIQNAIMMWIKVQYFRKVAAGVYPDRGDELFYGSNSMQNQVLRVLNKIKHSNEESPTTSASLKKYGQNGQIYNPLLKALVPDIYLDKSLFDNPKMVGFENSMLDDSDNSNAIERAWDELYRDDVNFIEMNDGSRITFKQFAINLAIYSFFTSGDRFGKNRFFKYVPNTIRKHQFTLDDGTTVSYADWIRDAEKLLPGTQVEINDAIDQILSLNWNDNDFVKSYRETYRRGKEVFTNFDVYSATVYPSKRKFKYTNKEGKRDFVWKAINKTIPLLMAAITRTKSKRMVSIRKTNADSFPPYIKIRTFGQDRRTPDKLRLYKLTSTKPFDDRKPEAGFYPIYRLVQPESSTYLAGTYYYDFIYPNSNNRTGVYDSHTKDAMSTFDSFYHNKNVLVEEFDGSRTELQVAFAKQIKEHNIQMSDPMLREVFLNEFVRHELPLTDETKIKAALEYVREQLGEYVYGTSNSKDDKQDNSTKQTTSDDIKSVQKAAANLAKAAANLAKQISGKSSKSKQDEKENNQISGIIGNIAAKIAKSEKSEKKDPEKISNVISNLAAKIAKGQQDGIVDVSKEEYSALQTKATSVFQDENGNNFTSVYQYYQYRRVDYAKGLTDEQKQAYKDKILNESDTNTLSSIAKEFTVVDFKGQPAEDVLTEGFYLAYKDPNNINTAELLINTGDSQITGGRENTNNALTRARLLLKQEKEGAQLKEECNK